MALPSTGDGDGLGTADGRQRCTVLEDPLEVSVTVQVVPARMPRVSVVVGAGRPSGAWMEKSGVRAVPLQTVWMTTWPWSPRLGR